MEVGALWVKLGLQDKEYNEGIKDAKGKGEGLAGFLKNAFSFAVGQGMFDLVKTGIKGAWDASIGFNSVMQQNEIAFNSMLGSADKAGALLKDLTKMAAETPFEFPELTDAAKKMLAFGFTAKDIPGMLTKIGDAAAGLGMGGDGVQRLILAIGQMKAKGKAAGGELMQLTEAGIPVWDILSKAMGKSTAEVMKLSEQGLIPADKAIQALTDGMESRFPNMMSKQSKSFQGLMSTLKDGLNQTFGQVFKPAFDWLTNSALPNVINGVNKFQESLSSGAPFFLAFRQGIKGMFDEGTAAAILSFTDKITGLGLAIYGLITGEESAVWDSLTDWLGLNPDLADTLTTALIGLHDSVVNVFSWIMNNLPTVTTIIAALTGAFVAYKLAVMASIATSEIQNALLLVGALRSGGLAAAKTALAGAEGSATIAQWALNAAMDANPIGIVIALIAALVAGIVWLWNTNEGFRNTVISVWNAVKEHVGGALTWLWNNAKTIGQGIVDAITNPWGTLINIASNIFGHLKDFIVNIFKNIHIPLPHFSLGTKMKEIAGISIPIPDLDINWYKTGGVFTGPSVIGVGEAGAEAVIPLNRLSGIIADTLNKTPKGPAAAADQGNILINMNGAVIREEADIRKVAQELKRLIDEETRRRG